MNFERGPTEGEVTDEDDNEEDDEWDEEYEKKGDLIIASENHLDDGSLETLLGHLLPGFTEAKIETEGCAA